MNRQEYLEEMQSYREELQTACKTNREALDNLAKEHKERQRQEENLIRIGRFEPSSKMCLCGYINKDLKLKDREWNCPNCGRHNDRDLLAAMNIKRFGLQRQNLIGEISPVVDGEGDVESPTMVGAVKRQYVKF